MINADRVAELKRAHGERPVAFWFRMALFVALVPIVLMAAAMIVFRRRLRR